MAQGVIYANYVHWSSPICLCLYGMLLSYGTLSEYMLKFAIGCSTECFKRKNISKPHRLAGWVSGQPLEGWGLLRTNLTLAVVIYFVSKILGRSVKRDICDSPTIIYDSCTKLLEVLKVCVVNTMFLKKSSEVLVSSRQLLQICLEDLESSSWSWNAVWGRKSFLLIFPLVSPRVAPVCDSSRCNCGQVRERERVGEKKLFT
jgi:hypothetical protein